MRKLLGGAALSLCLVAPAMAADLRMPVKAAPAPVVAAFSWTGCYIGGHVGGLWGRTEWTNPDVPNGGDNAFNQDVDYTKFTGGGHIGCNYQVNSWVVGIEGDASWVDVDKYGIADLGDRDEILRTKFNWYASIRGRLGVAANRHLFYGTGGVAFSRVRNSYENYDDATLTVLDDPISLATRSTGWVAGGGWEYAFTNNWIARAEYLHFHFGRQNVISNSGLQSIRANQLPRRPRRLELQIRRRPGRRPLLSDTRYA